MSSGHLVDPELAVALQLFPPLHLSVDTLPSIRASVAALLGNTGSNDHESVCVEHTEAPSAEGGHAVPLVIYRPKVPNAEVGIVLQIHGGGYIMGSPLMSDAENRFLCAKLGCTVVAVDYRLAPENPHPRALEDCYIALKYVHSDTSGIKGDRARLAVSGDSAGGGLAAALCLLARDRAEIAISFQHLMYPMLDDRTCVRTSPGSFTGEFIWTADNNRFGWTSLLQMQPGSAGVSSYAAAARAENLSRLPAAFIGVGALDLFFEENIEYAKRLVNAGVPVELHVYPGAFHGFKLAKAAAVAKAAVRDSLDALRRAVAAR